MANSLGRSIQAGEIIVVAAATMRAEFRAIEQRLVVAKSGFGLSHETMGRAVFAQDLFSREEFRWDGHQFDADETAAIQAQLAALELDKPKNAAALLELTGQAAWAQDVIRCVEIIAERNADLPAPSDMPPSLSNR